MIVKFLTKILDKRASKWIRENLENIDDKIMASRGYFNQKCHWNSYNQLLIHPNEYEVVACFCIEGENDVISHFINYSKQDEKYVDFTLGTSVLVYDNVYVLGACDFDKNPKTLSDVENMGDKLDDLKKFIIKKSFKNKLIRKFYFWLNDKYCII